MFCFPNSDHVMLSGNLPFVLSLIMLTYALERTCITRHLNETVLWGTITWSEVGKQNIQAKKVYFHVVLEKSTASIICTFG